MHAGPPSFPPFEEYQRYARAAGISGAVLTQHFGEFDNEYLLRCAATSPSDLAVIGMVDCASTQAPEEVARAASFPAFRGVRLRASTRSPGDDPLAIWRAIEANGLVASVRGPVASLVHPSFAEMLRELPSLKVRIDHLGLFAYGIDTDTDFERLMALSAFPNVHLLWAGFHAYSTQSFPYRDAHPYLLRSLAAFGAQRIMWSGDWARAGHAAPHGYYSVDARLVRTQLGFLTKQDRVAVLGGTARRLFRLGRP
ncbi:amidohydrolase [Nostocoides sp. HKS02]|uniref:amidohydrolase family protein n=1 Tax=Nostocoides sp. HKS02 TaxID=1813880 RepID=UPI0018A80768|nr:amidohydrolase family protein [Tetrasphaera sp. HKS02]